MNIINTLLLQTTIFPAIEGGENIDRFLQNLIQDFFIVGGILYVIFAVVVIRQIIVMKKTLITSFSPIIETLGYIHLVISILVLLFYIVAL